MRLLPLVSLALLSACAGIGRAPTLDPASARDAVVAADRGMFTAAQERGLGEVVRDYAWRGVYAVLPDQELVSGPVGLANVLAGLEMGRRGAQWEMLRAEASADGAMGYTFGRGSYRREDGQTGFARYVAVWTRVGREWRMAAAAFAGAHGPGTPPPAGFGASAPAPAALPGDGREQVLEADRAFAEHARARGVQAAFDQYAADDAVLVAGPVYGREAIRGVWEGGHTSMAWRPVIGLAGGGLGATVGSATLHTRRGVTVRESCSNYLTVWRRGPEGAWRYVADLGVPCRAPGS